MSNVSQLGVGSPEPNPPKRQRKPVFERIKDFFGMAVATLCAVAVCLLLVFVIVKLIEGILS